MKRPLRCRLGRHVSTRMITRVDWQSLRMPGGIVGAIRESHYECVNCHDRLRDPHARRRGLRDRVWFYRPVLGWSWAPWRKGGDEWDWHTIVLGWPWTGQVVYATRRCPMTGRCSDTEPLSPDWPADPYVTYG